ncbi:FCP1 homology domain [Dillenia turbinata]|uniref:Mitochondrial import inner membrane translocase subunit TIM50 n=1 Tax=Dillenia turbinata TaxID=194707 RepID=A0AAN8Z0F0_9MAGN
MGHKTRNASESSNSPTLLLLHKAITYEAGKMNTIQWTREDRNQQQNKTQNNPLGQWCPSEKSGWLCFDTIPVYERGSVLFLSFPKEGREDHHIFSIHLNYRIICKFNATKLDIHVMPFIFVHFVQRLIYRVMHKEGNISAQFVDNAYFVIPSWKLMRGDQQGIGTGGKSPGKNNVAAASSATPNRGKGFKVLKKCPPEDLCKELCFENPLLPSLQFPARRTIFLDLDETLIHSKTDPSPQKFDFIVKPKINGEIMTFYVLKRPGVDEFLDKLRENFEVIVFSAGLREFASLVLDRLDKIQ